MNPSTPQNSNTMNSDFLNKPLHTLTVGEFLELAKKATGISGLADVFGCSVTTAQRIKASGKIDRAITQTGRTIVIDAELALELANFNNRRKAQTRQQ